MPITAPELNQFVSRSDSLGGPGTPACDEYWSGFTYVPSYQVDQGLDPFSEAYVAEQLRLYEEIAGRSYDAPRNEQLDFDIERHTAAVNPYDHPDPGTLAMHLQRLSRALRLAMPRRGDTLLDMGCGWGLSSELAAYLGLRVVAVDINPGFVQLVGDRARRGGRSITAVNSTFEEFTPAEPADLILFYECLHHAVRPWSALRHLAAALKSGGRVVLAGEPINDAWWTHWGLRLDALSVYCIRKCGWFESGWTLRFILQSLHRAGLVPTVSPDGDAVIGYTVIGKKPEMHRVPGYLAPALFGVTDSGMDGEQLVMTGSGGMELLFPDGAIEAVLNLVSYRPRPVRVTIQVEGGSALFDGEMASGYSAINVPRSGDTVQLHFNIESWIPDAEIGNGDRRTLGISLKDITFKHD